MHAGVQRSSEMHHISRGRVRTAIKAFGFCGEVKSSLSFGHSNVLIITMTDFFKAT